MVILSRLLVPLVLFFYMAGLNADPATVRLGLLKYGTVNWEIGVIRDRNLAETPETTLQVTEFAGSQASQIALQAGAVDVIVADWVWVARQRAEGRDLSFVPFSASVASLVVPADSSITHFNDLIGKRIGIAGGPLDKTWLLLQALALKERGVDLTRQSEAVYGAPPLINQQIMAGRVDAVINYWHFVVRLESAGMRRLMGADDILAELDITDSPPLLGFVFHASWANQNSASLKTLVEASRRAKKLICENDQVWKQVAPMTKAETPQIEEGLRAGYCAGTPTRWNDGTRANAQRILELLKSTGGRDLVGEAEILDSGTFWPGFDL